MYSRSMPAAFVLAVTLTLSGCTSGAVSPPPADATPSSPSGSSSSGSSGSESTPSATCVRDPEAVIASTLPAGASGPVDDTLAAELATAAAEGFDDASAPGALVAVQTPEGTWQAALGTADPDTGAPMTLDMHQRIGSVTKTFTGTLILQLVEDGLLSLDDRVDQYFDGVTYGAEITVEMLLNMTSGISSYSLNPEFQDQLFADPYSEWTPEQLIAEGVSLPPQFAPGERFDYSNTNFIMLGRIAEMVTDDSYENLLRDRIIEPLGLTGTAMPSATEVALPEPSPRGFTFQGTPDDSFVPVDSTNWNPTWAWSAGQMTSTLPDMLRWARALATGHDLLGPDLQLERLTAMAPGGGYGYASGCIDGWFGHTGELPGFNTTSYYDSHTDSSVAVFTNSDIPSGECAESKTLPTDPRTLPCMNPAVRIFVEVSEALGHRFEALPAS